MTPAAFLARLGELPVPGDDPAEQAEVDEHDLPDEPPLTPDEEEALAVLLAP